MAEINASKPRAQAWNNNKNKKSDKSGGVSKKIMMTMMIIMKRERKIKLWKGEDICLSIAISSNNTGERYYK